MSVLSLLNATCTISRPTKGQGSASASLITSSWSSSATSVPCSIQPDRSDEAIINARDTGTVAYRVYFDSTVDIAYQDRLTSIVVDGTAWTGRSLAVTSVPVMGAGRTSYLMVTAEEKKGGGLP
mgnify:FL=1